MLDLNPEFDYLETRPWRGSDVRILSTFSFCVFGATAWAAPFFFSTGNPDGLMATGSRPASGPKIEVESADDFVLTSETSISTLTFTGLLAGGATSSDISNVVVEIYRVFPDLSDVGRTSGPPTFSTSQVPTRVNSPSDVALLSRDSSLGELNATTTSISPSFTANNSVLQQINPMPNQTTGGEGAITGQEVVFNVTLGAPIILPAGHYFFIPQVGINTVSAPTGEFYWLSAPKPIVAPGTPFPPGTADLQSWIRNENLAPDWLRVGKDIVGGSPAPAFNATFSLTGQTVPEPSSWGLVLAGACVVWMARRKRRV